MDEKSNKRTALYPGSFDPITFGHLDVLEKASKIFDKVIIAVLRNSSKKSFLPTEDRVVLIQKSVNELGFSNVEVGCFEGLTINYAREVGAICLIRGLRAVSDFEHEMQMSQTNSALAPEIGTMFLTTRPKYNFISSSIVKEISKFNGDISKFVPKSVVEYLKEISKER